VDVEHPETIAALERKVGGELGDLGVPALTAGVLRSEEREITMFIADTLDVANWMTRPARWVIHLGNKHRRHKGSPVRESRNGTHESTCRNQDARRHP
jgi:hypothetical protein